MPAKRIPVTVIGGFLGAGKTTLVNRLLRDARAERIAVLVNDFGAINVDAALVASITGDTIALTNGCVCCSIGDDLAAALVRLIDADPQFDAVVIEASGVSDPWRIAQVANADPALALAGVLVLVDAGAAIAQSRDPLLSDTLERQVRSADLIVLNKIDVASADELRAVRGWLDTLAVDTPRFETQRSSLPRELLYAPPSPSVGDADERGRECDDCRPSEDGHAHQAHDHTELFESWSARPSATLSAAVLRAALRAMPRGVLRLKGFVRTDALGWSELQFAGRHGSLRRALSEPAGGAVLVAIGLRHQLPTAELDALVERAAVPA